MSLDANEIAAVVAHLAPLLAGAVLQRVRQPAPDRLVLELYTAPGPEPANAPAAVHLLICVARRGSRLHLVTPAGGTGRAAGPLAMAARRDLEGRRLDTIEQLGDDRAVRLALGGPALVAELTGPHANVFLLRADGEIAASLWADRSRERQNQPGRVYVGMRLAQGGRPRGGSADGLGTDRRLPRPRFTGADAMPGSAIERWYEAAEAAAALAARVTALRRAASGGLERARRTIDRVRAEAARADEAPRLQRMAEGLVRGSPAAAPRGATSVRVTDWTEQGPEEIDVPLDPARGLKENAQRLFAQARRFRQGAERAAERLPALEGQAADLEEALAALAREDLPGAARLLGAHRLLPREERELQVPGGPSGFAGTAARGRRSAKRGADPDARSYRAYEGSAGQRILVGRDAAGNDRLTFAVARGNDLWLHARDHPGSHVVVPLPRGVEPDPVTLHEAALLAAHFSGARGHGSADVEYTRRKNVRKPARGAAGLVYVAGGRTLRVRIDEAVLQKLLERREDG